MVLVTIFGMALFSVWLPNFDYLSFPTFHIRFTVAIGIKQNEHDEVILWDLKSQMFNIRHPRKLTGLIAASFGEATFSDVPLSKQPLRLLLLGFSRTNDGSLVVCPEPITATYAQTQKF